MIRKPELGVILKLAAIVALLGPPRVSAQPSPRNDDASSTALVQAEPQHVWLHYDYMVFPRGWTSLAGIKYSYGLSMAPSEKAIDEVVDAFAKQGLTLHIDPQHEAIPGHQVLIPDFYPDWTNPSKACVGPDAVSFMALKKQYFRPLGNHPWHYAVFAFNGGLPDTGESSLCPLDGGSAYIDPLATGLSEVPGFNFLVSMGAEFDQGFTIDDYLLGGTFMHELGHNFGLQHGGGEALNYKPNYISVMNYSYQFGIRYAARLESATAVGMRLDYSRSALAPLIEGDLNEFVGVNAGTTDLVLNLNEGCKIFFVPAYGPIDWNCDGRIELHVAADIDNSGAANEILRGFDDWSYVKQQLQISPDVIEFMPNKMRYESRPKGRRVRER
jgi:Peptidase M66